jgi:hypothetical protein
MRNARDPRWYRAEPARMRVEAARATENPELRDSYLALSVQYERLAVVLEKSAVKKPRPSSSPSPVRLPNKPCRTVTEDERPGAVPYK